jgi:hypothetical protein
MNKIVIKGDIIHPFSINIIDGCYTVFKEKTTSKGVKIDETHGYFSAFDTALSKVIHLKAEHNLLGKTLEIKEYINEFRKIKKEIEKLLK